MFPPWRTVPISYSTKAISALGWREKRFAFASTEPEKGAWLLERKSNQVLDIAYFLNVGQTKLTNGR